MAEQATSKIEYGILFVFDNGEKVKEWYASEEARDQFLTSFIFFDGQNSDPKVYLIDKTIINAKRFLYAKAIERDVLKELFS